MELHELSLLETADGLRDGRFSSRDVTAHLLKRAHELNPRHNGYTEIADDFALEQAAAADARRADGRALSLFDGVPVALKDNLMVTGLKCTAGSNILKNYVATYDATVTAKLKGAGAVIIGKTNMDEFAMGSSTESSAHGPTKNPWDTERIPGGSSGGSAAVVAEMSVAMALGTDTGGSIRQPAALCGVVGLKPTYGRVSRYGAIAMASSLDQIGPVTRTVADAAATLKVIEGGDYHDANSLDAPAGKELAPRWPEDLKGIRIGLPKEYFVTGIDPEVRAAADAAIAKLQERGAEIKEVSLPHAAYALAVYYVLMPSEVSANLARFDGVRYGDRIEGNDLVSTYRATRGQGLGREVRRRIMLGTYALSSGYYDAYYSQAMKVRRLLAQDFAAAFNQVDVLAMPTSPVPAWKIGEKADDPLANYLADIFTVPVNVAGLPGVSVPCGLAHGLPVGLQLVGRHFEEQVILETANCLEQSIGRLTPKI